MAAIILATHAAGNAFLLHYNLFPVLEGDSFAMAHMDPSDIIATSFPTDQLCKFTALSLLWNLLVTMASRTLANNKFQPQAGGLQYRMMHVTLMIGLSTILIHLIIIICGIHPTMCPLHTLASALYLAFNMILPVLLFMPINFANQKQYHNSIVAEILSKIKKVNTYLFGPTLSMEQSTTRRIHGEQLNTQNRIHCIQQYAVIGTTIGMVACSIFRILDHGMQIQRYPIPIIMGATWGRCGGVLIGTVVPLNKK
mmetsp:Transcript_11509/g.19969  ORF Transcript_11509/g.19969 Transcript_11509/m.19969 type:complete len:254 (-) Transcript_11509:319-1080(-)